MAYRTMSDRLFLSLLLFSLLSSCIEQFEFESSGERPVVIIEGHISDISTNEFDELFGETRYFYTKVKYAGVVKNNIDEVISGAEVELISDQNEFWDYTEDPEEPGTYYLYYSDFASQPNVEYKINVRLPNGEEYESAYDQMPTENARGEISADEISKFNFEPHSGDFVIRTIDGLDVSVQLPPTEDNDFKYYRWDFHTVWLLVAELAPRTHPAGQCWLYDIYYLDENKLLRPKGSPAKTKLFFIQTSGNQQTKFGFSVRIRQQGISKEHHQFWADLHNQEEQSELFAPPPYNIYSNIRAVGQEKEVYGFFGVVNEEYYTWFLDKEALSYAPSYIEQCLVQPPVAPAEWCRNCLNKDGIKKGERNTNIRPIWWVY
ncbi:MAG: DUF4249 domain-containing protein [Reichenbachiella sp.]|uniref:DUF4249 domain-containing protein n=1 Tax=Reichenbachiella sp. TaxID=2184521 RepID=UPI0032663FAD